MIPNILSIAGSDPSGGAGIQADIKAISASGGYGMAAITALTAQNTQGVTGVRMVEPAFVADQISTLRDDIRIDAVKIGMLGTAEMVETVFAALEGLGAPVVLDPVMVAKGGARLLAAEAVAALRQALPRAVVITPNLPEAADLLAMPEATCRAEMETQARSLCALGARAVLLKGGHLTDGADCPDLLATAQEMIWLPGARTSSRHTHGTGCTLSAALATHLGHGRDLAHAARLAKAYVARAIAAAGALNVGHGHGPTHHFHDLIKESPN